MIIPLININSIMTSSLPNPQICDSSEPKLSFIITVTADNVKKQLGTN